MERRGLGLSGFLALVAIVAVVSVAAGVIPFRQFVAQQDSVELAEAKLEALRSENLLLEQQIMALGTPTEVERLAREHFGLVRPGEVGLVARAVPGVGLAIEVENRPLAPPNKPWWVDLWDFLTGNDVGDG